MNIRNFQIENGTYTKDPHQIVSYINLELKSSKLEQKFYNYLVINLNEYHKTLK